MGELSPEFKAELDAAARIVRQDYSKARIREVLSEYMDPKPPPEDDGTNPPPPPRKDGDPPEGDPPPEDPPTRKGLWWKE